MTQNESKHFDQYPNEPSETGESLGEINESSQANPEAELQKARQTLAEIDARLAEGTGQAADLRTRDEAKIEVVYLERKIQGSQWLGPDIQAEPNQSVETSENNPLENDLPKEE